MYLPLGADEPGLDHLRHFPFNAVPDSEGTVDNRRGKRASLLNIWLQGCRELRQGAIGVNHNGQIEHLLHHLGLHKLLGSDLFQGDLATGRLGSRFLSRHLLGCILLQGSQAAGRLGNNCLQSCLATRRLGCNLFGRNRLDSILLQGSLAARKSGSNLLGGNCFSGCRHVGQKYWKLKGSESGDSNLQNIFS